MANLPVFAGGAFKLELFLPEDYPMAAPKVCITITSLKKTQRTCTIRVCMLYALPHTLLHSLNAG